MARHPNALLTSVSTVSLLIITPLQWHWLQDLLTSVIGCEFVFLMEMASVLCGQHEREHPYRLSPAPKFEFADDFDTTNKLDPYIITKKIANQQLH
jgi:hypothetical protein